MPSISNEVKFVNVNFNKRNIYPTNWKVNQREYRCE